MGEDLKLEEAGLSKAAFHIMYAHARGYRVHRCGKVESFTGTILKLRDRFKGRGRRAADAPYLEFCAADSDGRSRSVMVHRLQAYQKFGLRMFDEGLVVRHMNDITRDNSWDNIELGTYSENIMDKSPEARKAQARKAALASRKLTMDQARELRAARATGVPVRELCKLYDLQSSAVYAIINNRSYKEEDATDETTP